MSTWLRGYYYSGSDYTRTAQVGVWRNRAIDLMGAYMPYTWPGVTNLSGWGPGNAANPFRSKMLISVGMIPSSGASIAAGAAGDYDAYWVQCAQQLIARGMGAAIIRIGHEHNGTWMAWYSGGNPSLWATYFQRIVTAMRSVAGQAFKFDWTMAVPDGGYLAVENSYPGDAYVDYIGVDMYDQWYGQPGKTAQQRFDHLRAGGSTRGLDYWKAFADAHGKLLGVGEWGVVNTGASMSGPNVGGSIQSGAGGDSADFIQLIFNYFSAAGSMGYDCGFGSSPSDGHHMLAVPNGTGAVKDSTEFPLASAAYRAVFGPDAVTPPPVDPGDGGVTIPTYTPSLDELALAYT